MSFIETIERARHALERNGRLSIRALQREFDLDAEALEALVEELVDVQQVAAREGKILSWLGEAPIPDLERVAERDPREYTPRHLADKILRSRSALEGERKHVTVLFADVEGSMELAGRLEAEEWHRLLDRFFGILTSGVHRFEGTVNQYTGDGIMALFGAPIAHEDHAQRACHAALHLRDALRDYAAELRRSHGLELAVRMGINTGEVVVGRIGDDLRMDYTAQGQSVGLAQRLEQLAPGGSIYLSDATAQRVEGYFELRDQGETTAKGITDPVGVFELVGLGSHRTRLDVARGRGLTRFVGRAADLQTLETALEQACAGDGQVVGVVSEAGVGKSRLCLEFVERCRARGISVDEGHCLSHGETVALLPLLELLRNAFAIGKGASGAEARTRIEAQLSNLEAGFRPLLPLLFDLLGVPDPARPAPPLPPEVRERQLSAFLRQLVRDRSEREPRVLFIDDAHWIDPASDALLAQMIEAVPGTRTLVVFNFRPEYRAEWMGRSHYRQLPLLPLGREATGELLADLLGPDPSLVGLAEEIHERTGGNPFFVEEVVLSLVESGCLAGERGAYRRVAEVGDLEIPDGVQAVLAARIDRLPEREKRLLQTASVVGRQIFGPVLARVAALSDRDLADALATLVRREFLFEEALHPDAGYAFKHPLTQEVAYRSQLAEGRVRTHGLVAEAIEAVHADDLDEQAALLAYHSEEAREPVDAARWNLRAAAWGETAADVSGATSHWRKARALLAEAPESDERDEVELEACRQLLTYLAWQGGAEDEVTSLFERGRALAESRGERRILGQLHIHYGVWRSFSANDLAGLGTHVRAAAELAEQVDDPGIAIAAAAGLSLLGYTEGRLPEAIAIGRRGLERAPDDPMLGGEYWNPPPVLWLRGFVRSLEAWAGHPAESLAALAETMEQARNRGSEVFIAIASLWSGQAAEILGDAEEAMANARRIESFCEKAGVPLGGSYPYYLGIAHLLAGNTAEAVPSLERARDIHEEAPAAPLDVVGSWCRLAVAYAEEGEAELARATSERGVALTRERLPVMLAPALTMHARVLRKTRGGDDRDAIEAALAEAEASMERVGLGCCRPFLHAERAALAGLLGETATLEREGRAALRLLGEMGAAGHAERVARELGGLG